MTGAEAQSGKFQAAEWAMVGRQVRSEGRGADPGQGQGHGEGLMDLYHIYDEMELMRSVNWLDDGEEEEGEV